jgi:hypothetical protein
MANRTDLEQAAIDAHTAGTSWAAFWRQHVTEVSAAEPAGDGWPRPCPWEIDDLGATNPAAAEK